MKKEYEVGGNNLILDGHTQDAKNIIVDVSEKEADGKILRGQVIDLEDGKYKEHEKDGKVNCIVAGDVSYEAGDDTIVVSCYITGSFRKSALVTDEEITEADEERFRELGIILG